MSNGRRAILVGLCALLVALAVWLDRTYVHPGRRSDSQNSTAASATADIARYHGHVFEVAAVVDGDTLDIDVPDGTSTTTRIRLLGIDTPEMRSAKGKAYFAVEAQQAVRQCALREKVHVYLDQGGRTRGYYGRLLAYVRLPDGRFLNEALLAEGFAYADLRFPHSLYNKYKQLEAIARNHKRGLWADVRPEQLPEWLQDEKPGLLSD